MNIEKKTVLELLKSVKEPTSNQDLVSDNRILRLEILDGKIILDVETTQPTLHARKKLEQEIKESLSSVVHSENLTINILVNHQKRIEEKKVLKGVKYVIAIASGKGGVGKSTVAVNLACALTKLGQKVGIVDADIYGFSVPLMMDTRYNRPKVVQTNDGRSLIEPVENYGIKMLSIGYFSGDDQAIAWRGPMASKALTQLFTDANWGELDYLIIDLPPGTGDIHLTLVSQIPLTGAILVSTPQEVALADARKGAAMFNMPNIQVPILGFVENMAWFTPEELPENKYYIFGKEGVLRLAKEMNLPVLGQIPLVQGLRESGDIGFPAGLNESHPAYIHFRELATSVIEYTHLRFK
jgi:ATP-binding protein involved in chromosome partitioning